MMNIEDYPNIKAMHILKDNKVLLEQFRQGIDADQLFPIGCIFKSFLSVLVGIAIYEGKIESIEDCVLDYFPHDEVDDSNWYKLKIKHALSKTTGLIWPGPKEPIPENITEVMQLKFESEPGVQFQYKPDPQIIVYLLEQVYDIEITQLLEIKLLKNFANMNYLWSRTDIQNMYVSLQLLQELGQLMLNKGMLGETRLFSEAYYEQSISIYSSGGFPECLPYGFGWWINFECETPYLCASGFGGQYLVVAPEKHLVISLMSDMDRPHPENRKIIESLL